MIKTHAFLCNACNHFVHVDTLDMWISEFIAVLTRFKWIAVIKAKEIKTHVYFVRT